MKKLTYPLQIHDPELKLFPNSRPGSFRRRGGRARDEAGVEGREPRTTPGAGQCAFQAIADADPNDSSTSVRSLSPRHARRSCEMVRGVGRSKLGRPIVPLTGLSCVRGEAENAPFGQKGLIETHSELKRRLGIAGDGGTFERDSRRRDVATLQEILPDLDQGSDLVGIE